MKSKFNPLKAYAIGFFTMIAGTICAVLWNETVGVALMAVSVSVWAVVFCFDYEKEEVK